MNFQKLLTLAIFILSAYSARAASDPTAIPEIVDLDAIDARVSPCENFYQYACGSWLERLQLPDDKDAYSHQGTALDQQSKKVLYGILTQADPAGHLKKYLNSCEGSEGPAKALETFRAERKRIENVQRKSELAPLLAHLHLIGVRAFFDVSAYQDFNDATRVIAFLGQGGLSLSERDYYLSQTPENQKIRAEYLKHVEKALALLNLGSSPSDRRKWAALLMTFETSLAQHSLGLDERSDPSVINHPATLADIRKKAPHFAWDVYFAEVGLRSGDLAFNFSEPDFYGRFDELLVAHDLSELKKILLWDLALRAAPMIAGEVENENFNFWQGVLRGRKAPKARWEKCTDLVSVRLTEEMGHDYVKALHDADQVKAETHGLIEKITAEFGMNLETLSWLDEATRNEAAQKLHKVNVKVAFPDQWRGMDGLVLSDSDLLANDIAAVEFESRRQFAKIGRPVAKDEWGMAPWEINAYYDSSLNEMVFPYGTLQSPVFDLKASAAANMGALGATVGHELTHGFDDQGSQFDGVGNARDWWTPAVRKSFTERAQCLIDQANKYEILPGLFVNGKATLSENIADQGGTKIAYLAYRRMMEGKPPASEVGGFNQEQQFFLSYAQSWCTKRREASLRSIVMTDSHPPEEFRVNAVLANRPEFSAAFSCREKVDRMAPANRCDLW